ncbi:uncharacterized protein [Aristolochia californica]|uniref:uncharacterized protein isoform X2 n=1 Tax=Aristolochia californica TaxID=171875 RepID=UPI0035D7B05B
MDGDLSMPLPKAFLDFLEENGLDASIYAARDSIPRYIRIKPGGESQIPEVEMEIKCKLENIVWLPGFFAIPAHIQIASSKAYQEGKIYGIDAASGAAVMSLDISPGDHVLDLCAAPGAKLCMLSDLLGNSGSLTGVDVAKHRLAACRSMLQKYSLGDRCRLFVADGSTFSLLPLRVHTDSRLEMLRNDMCEEKIDVFREWTSRRSWKERKMAAKARNNLHVISVNTEPELIFYGQQSGVIGLSKSKLFESGCSSEASKLGYDKLKLLTNGFKLLKTGGSLVYSTCSLTVAQNEDVVDQFLSENPSAELQEINAAKNWPCRSGGIPKTLRFDPLVSRTSGLFIAKFVKLST